MILTKLYKTQSVVREQNYYTKYYFGFKQVKI